MRRRVERKKIALSYVGGRKPVPLIAGAQLFAVVQRGAFPGGLQRRASPRQKVTIVTKGYIRGRSQGSPPVMRRRHRAAIFL